MAKMYNLYLGNEYWYTVYAEDEHEALALFSSFQSLSDSLGKKVSAEIVDVSKILEPTAEPSKNNDN